MYLALLNVTAVSPLQKKKEKKKQSNETRRQKVADQFTKPLTPPSPEANTLHLVLRCLSQSVCFFYFSLTALLQAQGSHNTQAASTDTSLEESSSSASDWCSFHNTMLVQDTQVMKSTDVHAHTEITACARCRCANHAFSHSLLIASIVGIVWERVSDLPRPV